MSDLDDLITSLRPDTDDSYRRRRASDLARAFAAPRRRAPSLRLRLVAAAVPVVLAGVVAAVVLAPSPPDRGAAAPMGLRQILLARAEEPVIVVILCQPGGRTSACAGRTGDPGGSDSAITERERRDVETTLTAMPGVAKVAFEGRAAAYQRFREWADQHRHINNRIIEVIKAEGLPETFRVRMKPDADWNPVIDAAKGMPGVADVVDRRCVSRC